MKILIDGFWWNEGPVSNRQVLREQVLAWRRMFPDDELHITTRSDAVRDILHATDGSIHTHLARVPQHGLHVMLELPILSLLLRPDAVFSQNFVPLFAYGKVAAFVHDLIFETNPEWFTRLERAYLSFVTKGLKRADLVLTSSQTERDRIALLHRELSQIHSVGIGIATELATSSPRRPNLDIGKYNFWLTVGRLNVRKNLAYAVKVALNSGRITVDKPLVVVGESQGKDTGTAEFDEAIRRGLVVLAGAVTAEELVWLYTNCSAFLFTTLDEGFGLPAVEAGFFSAPLLLSDIRVMREVSSGQATYIPLDDPSLAASVAASFDERDSLGDRKAHRIQPFDWDESVSKIRSLIEDYDEK